MNSDELNLMFSSNTESEEDYTFTGFSEQDLIMGDTSSSSKKHSKTKRNMPTTWLAWPLYQKMWRQHHKMNTVSDPVRTD